MACSIMAVTLIFAAITPAALATEDPSAEQEAEFQEWYNASQENRDYYHWHEWVHASPENEAYWRWKTEQDQRAQAQYTAANDVDAAIAHYFGDSPALHRQARNIVQCESGFNPNAKSPTNDHGIFQINAPSHSRQFPNVTGSAFYNGVYNPWENAEYARYLYNQAGWGPWSCSAY